MIKVLGHDIRMTTVAEARLVQEAKAGNWLAEKMLLDAYIEPIKDVHRYSAVGKFPHQLSHNYNFKGISFEEHGEPLAQIHHHCIQLFDFEKKHKTAKLPYLKYLLDTIDHRALDYLKKEQLRTSREVSISDLKVAHQDDMDWENMNHDDLLDVVACREEMHDNAAQEFKDAEMKKLCDKVIAESELKNAGPYNAFMKGFLKAARERVGKKKFMNAVAQQITGDEEKRGNAYYYQKTAADVLSVKRLQEFHNACEITGE